MRHLNQRRPSENSLGRHYRLKTASPDLQLLDLTLRRLAQNRENHPQTAQVGLARAQMKKPLWERIKPLRDEIAAYPDSGVIVDKAFFDELSGEAGE